MTDYVILIVLVLIVACLFGVLFLSKANATDKCEVYCRIQVPRSAPDSKWVSCMEQCLSRQQ